MPLHLIDTPGPSEVALGVDLTGDGKLDIFPNTVNVVVFYSLEKAGPSRSSRSMTSAPRGRPWPGYGDVNGDGRVDLAHPQGLVRISCSSRPPRPGPGTPPGTWARRHPDLTPATSTATAWPTSFTAAPRPCFSG